MISYHGTDPASAAKLQSGSISTKMGGGELGLGFYTGQHLFEAKAWAFHQTRTKHANVLQVEVDEDSFSALNIRLMDYSDAAARRFQIRRGNATRSYLFNCDVVWSPIVGSEKASGDQYKWESSRSERLLNGVSTKRSVR